MARTSIWMRTEYSLLSVRWQSACGPPQYERITLWSTQSTSSGLGAVGSMSGDTARLAVGSYFPDSRTWAILLDSSPSYYDLYTFQFVGFNLIEGEESTYVKGTSPSG